MVITLIIYTFNLTEAHDYVIINMSTNVLYQNVRKGRIEYIQFSVRDEHGWPIVFNGDVLSFTLPLV